MNGTPQGNKEWKLNNVTIPNNRKAGMITGINKKHKEESWQNAMINAVRDPDKLLNLLGLDRSVYKKELYFPESFKLLAPLPYIKKIKKGDWNDPLLRQILPLLVENGQISGFVSDPVGDMHAIISNGVLQKYQGRVLLLTTGACAVHCRYCFRRHFPYASSAPDKKHWQDTLQQIKNDESIHEVILSGGDPLMLSDRRLQSMCADLAAIPHVKTLRFHTRLPVILPERINESFLGWLADLKIQKVMVIHANHANEINDETGYVLQALVNQQVTVLNQSVLLKGVNNDVDSLYHLSQRLFNFQVLPYYIHLLDKVQGAAHFDVSEKAAVVLIKELKQRLPGYLVPKLVKEVSGERSKLSIE